MFGQLTEFYLLFALLTDDPRTNMLSENFKFYEIKTNECSNPENAYITNL